MTNQNINGKSLRLLVIASGLVLLVLLMFADKTNLNNQQDKRLDPNSQVSAPASGTAISSGQLPPLAADSKLDTWILEAEKTSGKAQQRLLDSVINRLSERRRYAYAAQYAEKAVAIESSLEAKLRLGRLALQASRLDFVAQDSVLFRSYSDQAVANLEEVVAAEAENEEALYYLGLAYVESKNPQNSMKGILTIRKILEINPDNVEAAFSMGMFSIQTGQFDKAIPRFEKVLQLQTENQSARYHLAYAKVQANQLDGVSDMLETVLQKATDPELKQMARNLINQIN